MLIKELSKEINLAKPWVKFGVSPAAVWGNKKDGHLYGSNTNAGLPNYDKSFADTKKWIEEEIIDYIAPQVYFSFANPSAPYGEVSSWWAGVTQNKNVHLYIGQALYKVNDNSDQYFQGKNVVEEFVRQHKFNVLYPQIKGSIMFRFQNFNDPSKQQVVNKLKNDLWTSKALVPIMEWKGGQAPAIPTQGNKEIISNGVKLTWIDKDVNTAYYAIYRSKDVNANKMELVGTIRKADKTIHEFIDKETNSNDKSIYAVLALDRLHNESKGLIIGSIQSNNNDGNNEQAENNNGDIDEVENNSLITEKSVSHIKAFMIVIFSYMSSLIAYLVRVVNFIIN